MQYLLVLHIQTIVYRLCQRTLLDNVHRQMSGPTTTPTKARPRILTGRNRIPTPNIFDIHNALVVLERFTTIFLFLQYAFILSLTYSVTLHCQTNAFPI